MSRILYEMIFGSFLTFYRLSGRVRFRNDPIGICKRRWKSNCVPFFGCASILVPLKYYYQQMFTNLCEMFAFASFEQRSGNSISRELKRFVVVAVVLLMETPTRALIFHANIMEICVSYTRTIKLKQKSRKSFLKCHSNRISPTKCDLIRNQ